MKKNMFKVNKFFLTLMFVLLFYRIDSKSQPLFVENFNFPVRDSLEGISGWFRSGGNSPYNVQVKSPGLTYNGYICSGVGNTAYFGNQPNGDIVVNSFSTISSGSVFVSFMLRVDSLTSSATEGFNICLDQSGGSTNNNTKVYVKKLTSNTFNLGIRKSDGSVKYSSNVYTKNTTYLVVGSYTFVNGTNNDISRLYVSTSGVPASLPSVPLAADTSGVDIADIGDIALLNSFIQTGLQGSSVKIDGIRIGTSWTNTLFDQFTIQLNLKALIQGFYNSSANKMVRDTARVILRYNVSPYNIADSSKAVLDSLGNGIFIFHNANNNVFYYTVVKHRNTIETWSNQGYYFYNNLQNFDFTGSSFSAYGGNEILSGSRFCMYNGDVTQDGSIDLTDVVSVNNNANTFSNGYLPTDINGNNITDLTDLLFTYNNSIDFISVIRP